MAHPLVADFTERLDGSVVFNVPLARYTTYRIGGPARVLVEPRHADDVRGCLALARERGLPWLVIGLGSNLLVSDDGFPGVVLRMGRDMARLEGDRETELWRVGAGLPTPLLARQSARAGRMGVHRLVGVPGTVGGGVSMNAGAHGQEFRNVVRAVELVTTAGDVESWAGAEVPWRYRDGGLRDVVILGTTLALDEAPPKRLAAEVRELLRRRKAGTPFNDPCCGSVFRNPAASAIPDTTEGERQRTAGQLIDAAGMKGFTVGGAQVSTLHANYIVNRGGATARDVVAVIDAVRRRVREEAGVELQLEVRLVGEFAALGGIS